ncbi:MAG: transposase [Acetobacteraceae bacterium]|jgi:transposase|nr:transposase [Acetobacteraceae bacterium]
MRMDRHTHSEQFQRLEVVDTGRRRRWSEDEKLRIVTESLDGPRLVSSTARRYGISPSQLFAWRRSFRSTPTAKSEVGPAFVPAVVIAEAASAAPAGPPSGRVEIVLANGRQLRVDVGIDGVGLARLVALLERP